MRNSRSRAVAELPEIRADLGSKLLVRVAVADNGDLFEHHRGVRLVAAVAGDAGDGLDYLDAGVVALAEEGVVLVEES